MDATVLSDQELVAVLVGEKAASELYNGRLIPLLIGDNDFIPHPMLQASIELARRVLREELIHGEPLPGAMAAKTYLKAYFLGRPYESFVSFYLDYHHRVVHIEELFRGTVHTTNIYPREVARVALKYNATKCIFAHNHPSGSAEPSKADKAITAMLKKTLALVDVEVIDHLVVAGNTAVSMVDREMM